MPASASEKLARDEGLDQASKAEASAGWASRTASQPPMVELDFEHHAGLCCVRRPLRCCPAANRHRSPRTTGSGRSRNRHRRSVPGSSSKEPQSGAWATLKPRQLEPPITAKALRCDGQRTEKGSGRHRGEDRDGVTLQLRRWLTDRGATISTPSAPRRGQVSSRICRSGSTPVTALLDSEPTVVSIRR
mgnify:CR=1 FL=1